MRVAIYARVSKSDQNPESQLHELREFANRRKFKLHEEYVDTVTGVVERRPAQTEYNRLLKDAHQRRFDCVLVWKFDRFARSLRSLLDALKTFDALGIHFISATQQIDTTTPMGRLFFGIVGCFAEFERELIVERTRAGLANAKRKGINPGPKRDISIEARARRMHERGLSLRAIAKTLKRSASGILLLLERAKPLPPVKQ
jgi:DNA invertase Pin-like site-specific DNA recombinase